MSIHLSLLVTERQILAHQRASDAMSEVWRELSHRIRVRGGNPLTAEISFQETPGASFGVRHVVTARGLVDTSSAGWDADGAPCQEWPR